MLKMLADCPELVQNDVLFGSNMILPEHAVVGVSVGVGGGKDGHLDARGVLVHRARVGLQRWAGTHDMHGGHGGHVWGGVGI